MTRRCCIKSCSNSKKPKDVIHMFPKSSSMKELWIGVVEKLNGSKLKVDVSNYGVCTQHFSPNDYSVIVTKNKPSSSGGTRRRLLPSAVPNISSDESASQSFNQAPSCAEDETSNNTSVRYLDTQIVSVSRQEFDGLVKSLKEVRRVLSKRTNKWKFTMGTMKNQLKQLRRKCCLQQQMITDLQQLASAGSENTANVVNPISQTVMEGQDEEQEGGDLCKLPRCLLCNNATKAIDYEPKHTKTTVSNSNESPSTSQAVEIKVEVEDEEETLVHNNLQQHDQHELITFLQTHFNVIITKISELSDKDHHLDPTTATEFGHDIFQFCGPCHHQLIAFKNLKAQIADLQRQSGNLKHKIAYGFNNSFLLRRKEMSARRRAMTSEQIDAKYAFIPSSPSDHDNSMISPVSEVESLIHKNHFKEHNLSHDHSPSLSTNEDNIKKDFTLPSVVIRPCSVVLHRIEKVSPPLKKPNDTLGENPPVQLPKPKPKYARKRKWDNKKGGPFICTICSKSFTTRHKRNLHVRAHSGLKPYACQICDKRFTRSDNLKLHVSLHSKIKVQVEPHVCTFCGNSYTNRKIYRLHLAQDHGVIDKGLHECSFCAKRFVRPRDLKHHIMRIHEGKKLQPKRKLKSWNTSEGEVQFECDACHGLSFNSFELLKEHRVAAHGIGENGEGLLICSTCNLVFISPENFSRHSELCKVHKVALPKPNCTKSHLSQVKMHQCEQCGRVLRTHQILSKHIRVVHEGERPFQCSVCGQRFSANSSFKLHMVHHTGEKLYRCDYCETRFNKLVRKKEHMVKDHPGIHLVQNPFVCPICYSIYSTEAERDEHVLQSHDKHKCKVCNKTFTNAKRLKAHMLIHTGEKPFVCQFCSKAFNKIENLKEHVYRHTGERPHKCKVQDCKQGFLRKKKLTIHMQKVHHNSEASEPLQGAEEGELRLDSAAVDTNFVNINPVI